MKQIIIGIANIALGILSTIYLLIQNGTIVLESFVIDHEYNDSFESFMTILMAILSVFTIILLIINIMSLIKFKKTVVSNSKIIINGYNLSIGGEVINLIGWALMGSATIFSALTIVGGIILIFSKSDNKV